jgi:hypothetical protein
MGEDRVERIEISHGSGRSNLEFIWDLEFDILNLFI